MKAFKIFFTAIICLSATIAFTQMRDTTYTKDWKLIDSLIIKDNATKTALAKVDVLYKKAQLQRQNTQAIKALIYKMELGNRVKEDNVSANIDLLKKEIEGSANTAIKSILWCLLAKQYNSYYYSNHWNINRRSETTEKQKEDITVWSKNDFLRQVFYCYNKSIEAKALLQQTYLNDYGALIVYGTEAELRPTLYDILAHDALEYYKSSFVYDYYGTDNASSKITNARALAAQQEFLNTDFSAANGLDANSRALQLFQDLISFHKRDKNPNPTIDVALERIVWVYGKAAFANKDELYIKALEEMAHNYNANNTAAQAWYLLAKYYSDRANNYKAITNTQYRFDHQKALNIINERLQLNSDSCEGNLNMQALKNYIARQELATKVEAVNVPNQPFRMLVNYRNAPVVYYRVIKLKNALSNDGEDEESVSYSNDDKFWKQVVSKKFIRQSQQSLPSINDYQQHSCEIKIDALPVGSYAVLTSTGNGFSTDRDRLSYIAFTVSSLSYIENNGDYFVVDRDNGNPIDNVKVNVTRKDWDNRTSGYNTIQVAKYTTDKNGFFSLKKLEDRNAYGLTIELTKNDDVLVSSNNNFYKSINNDDKRTNQQAEEDNMQVHFFLDRGIYRPGQTLYFKGIVTTKGKYATESRLYTNAARNKVFLRDVNGKTIDTIDVEVNEYGSFNGKFILPMNALTGNFSLVTEYGGSYIGFNVEEYKRPKFYVDFDKQKDEYKLNKEIKVSGNAKAYSGNSIDGAKVIYTVTRKARFENHWWFWRGNQPNSQAKQIKNGELKTDAQGKFAIDFIAEPDETIDRKTNPIFDYEIKATITDINGETRENATNISVGYNSIVLKIDAPEKVDANNFKSIKLSATNLAGESIATKVDIKISSLQTPTRLIRERFWERADTFVYSQNEYISYFPVDEYDNENDRLGWKEKEVVLKDEITTIDSLQFTTYNLQFNKPIPNSQLLVTATTKDKDGNLVETKAYVEVSSNNNLAYPQYHSVASNKTSAKAGEQVNIGFNSNAQNVYVLKNLVTSNETPNRENVNNTYSFEQVNNHFTWNRTFESNATKGFGMYYAFVKNNRFYNGGSSIELIKPSKKLNITYGTFRNKTLPGSKETYTLKISGENGEKVAAELLTAMYDASLDQFVGHNWGLPELEETLYFATGLRFNRFRLANSNTNPLNNNLTIPYIKSYASLFSNIHHIYYNDPRDLEEVMYKKSMSASVTSVQNYGITALPKGKKELNAMDTDKDGVEDQSNKELSNTQTNNSSQSQIRKNFNETAFFFPNIYANEKGEYSFSFTMPEALTKWKWLSLAHTKNLEFGVSENSVVTSKPIMVQPNTPRFLREGDVMELTAKIVNTTDKEITGTSMLELIDATTGVVVDGLFHNVFPMQYFTVAANQSSVVKFPVRVPASFAKPLTIRVVAQVPSSGGDLGVGYNDGEENTLPVLTNKIFLTESLPIYVKQNETNKTVDLKPLFNTANNRSNESITVEYTSNPVWNVVQALPYLMEYPYECAEQTFNRFFANAMAASIVRYNKNIQRVIKKWNEDTTHIKSKLQLNEELKSIINTETPWVFDAESEVEQQKRLALLLDLDKMQNNIDAIIEKLKTKQLSNGAFSWFDGGRENDYITQYIVTGIGKLKMLNALTKQQQNELNTIASKALPYLDFRIEQDYKNYIDNLKNTKNKFVFWDNSLSTYYWYMRSMFMENKLSATLEKARKLFTEAESKNWTKESIYMQGMLAVTLNRFGNETKPLAKKILNTIKENSFEDTVKGTMYWKQNQYCYYWYQNNFETQALLIQAFAEQNNSDADIDKMKTWLILNKQTNKWNSTIATSAACYALLNYGSNWVSNQQTTQIQIGNKTLNTTTENGGYIKSKIDERTVNAIISSKEPKVTIINQPIKQSNNSPSYGAVYFQYFADVNDVKSSTANAPLTLVKKLFIEKNNGTKKVLEPVNDNDELDIGDKLIVRIELSCERQMEFLHLKDMRAASTEPVNVLSSYKWQDGLGYYESTRDASTNFFIDNIYRGTYVFEYPLFITHSGNYSVGLAQIQCMYAPEFTSHSNGIKIRVK